MALTGTSDVDTRVFLYVQLAQYFQRVGKIDKARKIFNESIEKYTGATDLWDSYILFEKYTAADDEERLTSISNIFERIIYNEDDESKTGKYEGTYVYISDI